MAIAGIINTIAGIMITVMIPPLGQLLKAVQ